MFEFQKALPEELGISPASIRDTLLFLDKKEIPMHSFLLMRGDKLVLEKYYAPYKENTLHRMFSISKTFTALAVSLLADEGKLSLDDPIVNYFPEYTDKDTHPWIKATTIRNMLMMRTCHAKTTYKVDMKSDWVRSFFVTVPSHKPGTIFNYDTSAAHVLCALVEKLTGMKMLDYMKKRFLNHLDFSENSYMVSDPFGVSIGGSGLMATPMDVLKVLYVLSHNGEVTCDDGIKRTLINPDFIKEATSNLSDNLLTGPIPSEAQGYGMQIWQNEQGGFVLYGMGGQLAINIPDKELLIMTTADNQGIAGGNQVIYDAIYNILLPGIDSDSSSTYQEMMDAISPLRISAPRLPASYSNDMRIDGIPELIRALAGKRDALTSEQQDTSGTSAHYNYSLEYNLENNSQGFKKLQLLLSETEPSKLCLIADNSAAAGSGSDKNAAFGADATYNIQFGINDMHEGNLDFSGNLTPEAAQNENGTHYTAGAIWLRNNSLYIRVHLIDECVGSIRMQLFFDGKDIVLSSKKVEETYFNVFNTILTGHLA